MYSISFLFHWFMFLGLPTVLVKIFGIGNHTLAIYLILLGAYLGNGIIRRTFSPRRRRPRPTSRSIWPPHIDDWR